MSDVTTDEWLTEWATVTSPVPVVTIATRGLESLCRELLAHRAAERERAKVPMPISRERLAHLAHGLSHPIVGEACALARFALAHMQQPLDSGELKETEPKTAVEPENVRFTYTHNMLDPTYHGFRTALLATVKGSSEVDTVRRAALALIDPAHTP